MNTLETRMVLFLVDLEPLPMLLVEIVLPNSNEVASVAYDDIECRLSRAEEE